VTTRPRPGPVAARDAAARRRLAGILALIALAMSISGLVLHAANTAATGGSLESLGFNGVGVTVGGAICPALGWLIVARRPGNAIGWIFLAIGLSQAGTAFADGYATYGLVANPGSLPFADVMSWVTTWSWAPGFVLLFVLVLVFPDGRLPSPRWRPVLWLAGLVLLMVVPTALVAWGYRGVVLVAGSPPDSGSDPMITAYNLASTLSTLLCIPLALASIAAVIVRFRHAGMVEREQIKWVATAGAVELGVLVLSIFVPFPAPLDVIVALVVVSLLPVAIAIAILRYRLYEIDRLVSRTISWALVSAVLVAVFVVAMIALQAALAGLTGGQTLAVAASTLVAAALAQPLRRRVQVAVDRRFDRAQVTAAAAEAGFGAFLRTEIDLARIADAFVASADGALHPDGAALWVRSQRSADDLSTTNSRPDRTLPAPRPTS
jgi:hypothetical protein